MLEDRIRVYTKKIWIIGDIDAHIQGVGLPAVFLPHQGNRHLPGPGLIDFFLWLTGNPALDGTINTPHVKGVLHHLGGFIGGSIVYHNNLIEFIVQRQQ